MKRHSTEYLLKKKLCAPGRNTGLCPYEFVYAGTGRVRIYLTVDCIPSDSRKKSYIGQFYIDRWSRDNTGYFRAFSISPRLRGRGIGTEVFPHILAYLYRSGFRNVVLQVSDSNPAALQLYKNNGFEVLESVIL